MVLSSCLISSLCSPRPGAGRRTAMLSANDGLHHNPGICTLLPSASWPSSQYPRVLICSRSSSSCKVFTGARDTPACKPNSYISCLVCLTRKASSASVHCLTFSGLASGSRIFNSNSSQSMSRQDSSTTPSSIIQSRQPITTFDVGRATM